MKFTKPEKTDFIELWVENDSSIILCKRSESEESPVSSPIVFPSLNLCFGIDDMESLYSELSSYGAEKTDIKRAILAVSFAPYNEEITV
jgi:hypothetical protein